MPSPEACVLSACYGDYDDPCPALWQDIPCDFIFHTDSYMEPLGWNVIRHSPNGIPPVLSAKKHKLLPEVPHRYVIWIDANIRIESKSFVREAISYIKNGIAVFQHPFRNDVFQEGLETILTPKYDDLPIADQIRTYHREEGYGPDGGLYACGVIAWDLEDPKARQIGQSWMAEIEKWGHQDQLSLPIVLRRLGIEPGVFPGYQYRSGWFRILPHR